MTVLLAILIGILVIVTFPIWLVAGVIWTMFFFLYEIGLAFLR